MEELGQVVVNGGVSVVLAYVVVRWLSSELVKRASECKECAARNLEMAREQRDDKMMVRRAAEHRGDDGCGCVRAMGATGSWRLRRERS